MVDSSIRELRGARILVLDNSGNIHSIWKPGTSSDAFMTKSYWEFLATLPTLAPEGSIGERRLILDTNAYTGTTGQNKASLRPA